MTYMILIANNTVKLSKRDKAGKQYLWILITTYYLLSKNWDVFATRRRISLIINMDYFRGGEVSYKVLHIEIVQADSGLHDFSNSSQSYISNSGGACRLVVSLGSSVL